MKNTVIILAVFLIPGVLFSQQSKNIRISGIKDRYNIQQTITDTKLKSTSLKDQRLAIQNPQWQYSVMDGGFFTIGLNKGEYDSKLDDNCQITFGHPFSLTSFGYITVDGKQYMPEELMTNEYEALDRHQDTLIYRQTVHNTVISSFYMHINSSGNLELVQSMENTDSVPHTIGADLFFDVALGKWGDGFAMLHDTIFETATTLTSIPDSISIFERKTSPQGIGIALKYPGNKPATITCSNWDNLYYKNHDIQKLYDLALLHEWNEVNVAPSETITHKIEITELAPDFNNELFMRWSLPRALSIEKNMLFPMSVNTTIDIYGESTESNLKIRTTGDPYIGNNTSDSAFTVYGNDSLNFQNAQVQFREIYDSVVVPITITLTQNGQKVDEFSRNVFIPKAPFSNEGLNVSIDSLYENNGVVNLSFSVTNKETQQLLYELYETNTFFYHNDQPVEEYQLGKDTSGGINEVDIIFVLDVTGSMSNEIEAVRNNIMEFTDSLTAKGFNYRLGMVTFLDEIENVYEFTKDPTYFKSLVGEQYAHGGGDYPENSLEALKRAAQYQFRANAKRIFIWITDASFHINNSYTSLTKQDVVDELLAKGVQTHCIGNTAEQLDYYDQIVLNTGGDFYDIDGNFRDILLDVSRLGQSPNYILSYEPDQLPNSSDELKVDVHYAGLGGADSVFYENRLKQYNEIDNINIELHPTPFDHQSKIYFNNRENCSVKLQLVNLLGQTEQNVTINCHPGKNQINLSDVFNTSHHLSRPMILRIVFIDQNNNIIDSKSFKTIR